MLLGIDYDETWTLDRAFWRDFCVRARRAGHRVVMVTARFGSRGDESELLPQVRGCVEAVVFAGLKPKRIAACEEGYDVDVWIDDTPANVDHGKLLA